MKSQQVRFYRFQYLADVATVKNSLLHVPETTDDFKTSAVYSLAVHNQALWLLSGLEVGVYGKRYIEIVADGL
jgi:hypothetical protein